MLDIISHKSTIICLSFLGGPHYTIPNKVIVTFYVIYRQQWVDLGTEVYTTQEVWITD